MYSYYNIKRMDYEMTTYLGFGLFLLSEGLSLVKKTKGNGIIHTLICIFSGSECVAKNLKEIAQKAVEEDEQKTAENKV